MRRQYAVYTAGGRLLIRNNIFEQALFIRVKAGSLPIFYEGKASVNWASTLGTLVIIYDGREAPVNLAGSSARLF